MLAISRMIGEATLIAGGHDAGGETVTVDDIGYKMILLVFQFQDAPARGYACLPGTEFGLLDGAVKLIVGELKGAGEKRRVKLYFEAPEEIKILRAELCKGSMIKGRETRFNMGGKDAQKPGN